jgi:hypothetical protein
MLDIVSPADCRMVVRMGLIRRCPYLLVQRLEIIIFASFIFVSDHGFLSEKVLFAKQGMTHAIGFNGNGLFDELRRQDCVVVCSIEPGGGVNICANVLEHCPYGSSGFLVVVAGALEHEVLQQMRAAGDPRSFVPGPDEVRDHDRGDRCSGVPTQQDSQSVGIELVLADARHLLNEAESGVSLVRRQRTRPS